MPSRSGKILLLTLLLQERAKARKQRAARSYEYAQGRFTLDKWSDEKCEANFRLRKHEIRQLVDLLQISEIEHTNGYKSDPEFSLCLVLYRLAFPCRLKQMSDVFGMAASSLSTIYNDTIMWISKHFRDLQRWHPLLDYGRMSEYAKILEKRVPPTEGLLWGWIDGTFKGMCRPTVNQKFWYSGYKKKHGIKYQAIVTPDGLIMSIEGPFEGTVNDVTMVRQSLLEERLAKLERDSDTPPDERIYLYGDEAYKCFHYILCPWPGGRNLQGDYRRRNKALSSLRISVEHLFGIDQSLWAYNAYDLGVQSGSMPIAAVIEVSFLLTNCKTCLRGNQVSQRFGITPMTVEQYLRPVITTPT